MRQFVSWRWWLTIFVLVGVTVLLAGVVGTPGGDELDEVVDPVSRRLDLNGRPESFDADDDWGIVDGLTRNNAEFTLDGRRYLLVPKTPGEDLCDAPPDRCAIVADRLGDAIVWFALVDIDESSGEVRLPPIAETLDGVTWARLTNGWELPLLSVVERRCDVETTNFADFLDRFGENHVTSLDVEDREISAVECVEN